MKFDLKTPCEQFDDMISVLRERGFKIRGNLFNMTPWAFVSTFSSRRFVHIELRGSFIMVDCMQRSNNPVDSPLCCETRCYDVGSASFDYISFCSMCCEIETWITPEYLREWYEERR